MSAPLTGSTGHAGEAAASSDGSEVAPPPVATTARSDGTSAGSGRSAASSSASPTSTRARLSRSIASHSSRRTRVLNGTATAPMRSAPRNTAAHSTPSGSRRATRCSGSTPRPRNALPARPARASSSR
jgi:hypothetical protein